MVLDSKHVLKVYCSVAKIKKNLFLPLPSELVWLKIHHLSTVGNCDSWQAKQGNVFEILCLVEDIAHTISICTLEAIHK